MDKKTMQNLSSSTMASIIEDLSTTLNFREAEVETLQNYCESEIEQLRTDHTYNIQKLHKEYCETITILKDNQDEERELHKCLIKDLEEKRGLDIHNAEYSLCKGFETQIVNTMTIILEGTDYSDGISDSVGSDSQRESRNLESHAYKSLLYLVEVMDTQLISMNITNNFQGRIMNSIKEILSVSKK